MKNQLTSIILIGLFILSTTAIAQDKRTLTWEDIIKWQRITESSISDDGKYVAVVTSPWRGDAEMKLHDDKGQVIATFERANLHEFLSDTKLLFSVAPSLQTLDSLERAKSKTRELSVLNLYDIKNRKNTILDSIVDFKLSKEQATIAYKTKDRTDKENLTIHTLRKELEFKRVKHYAIGQKAPIAVYTTDSIPYRVMLVDLSTLDSEEIYSSEKPIKRLTISKHEHGSIAFITGEKEEKTGCTNQLFMYNTTSGIKEVRIAENAPEGWIINEFGDLTFSKSGSRLVYATSPEYFVKDTTTLPSRQAIVDVWHWNEPLLHTEQTVNIERERKKSYTAIYFTDKGEARQIATEEMPIAIIPNEADASYAYTKNHKAYAVEKMWTGESRYDVYTIDLSTMKKQSVLEGTAARVNASPKGKYLYWYSGTDSAWYSHSIEQGKTFKMASPRDFITYNHLHDTPNSPGAQGSLLWNEDETALLAPSRYDIWQLSPTAAYKPKNITKIGAINNMKLSIILLDKEQKNYGAKEHLLLSTFNEETKESGFAELDVHRGKTKVLLEEQEMSIGKPTKAKDSDVLMFTMENFTTAPNVHLYSSKMKHIAQITHIAPQQNSYNWGTAELISWTSLRGDTLQGLLYKPENFDPKKKYPMICNFYERSSDGLFKYRTPETNRSTIDYHYYTSNGYIIFSPDIKYYTGEPGQSCYDALMPGIDKVVSMGFVDEKKIGAQGHSWGGYQVAHLATVTDRFAAIESGAPLVNMTSAYGGIRWGTGLNRAFQYEKTQSRLGKTMWEDLDCYISNSPLFKMDQVTTPILIMHNDADGHVPWHLGVEFFIALRRLQKPTWLLNYNDEPHWPLKLSNQIDFQTRMSEFFHHYLKDAPMPEWMESGVPAIEKGMLKK